MFLYYTFDCLESARGLSPMFYSIWPGRASKPLSSISITKFIVISCINGDYRCTIKPHAFQTFPSVCACSVVLRLRASRLEVNHRKIQSFSSDRRYLFRGYWKFERNIRYVLIRVFDLWFRNYYTVRNGQRIINFRGFGKIHNLSSSRSNR